MIVPIVVRAFAEKKDPLMHTSDVTSVALVAPHVSIEKRDKTRVDAQKTAIPLAVLVLERIAVCESKNDPLAKNPRSSASGRFQFLSSSWEAYGRQLWGSTEGKDVFSYKDNTELAEYVFSKEGGTPWMSSYECWK